MNKFRVRQYLRRNLGRIYSLPRRTVCDLIYDHRIVFNPRTDIGQTLFLTGEFEKDILDLSRQYIPRDGVAIDIGANIGIHSLFFADIATQGIVLAFEPSQETFSFLVENVRHISNIIPINLALSNEKGIVDFYIASDNAYSSLKDTQRKPINRTQKVICTSLDHFLEGLGIERLDFVKIDVEGFELNVLQGMQKTINTYRPVIQCEIYQGVHSNDMPEQTVSLIINCGYQAFFVQDGALIEYQHHSDQYYNYFFIPRK